MGTPCGQDINHGLGDLYLQCYRATNSDASSPLCLWTTVTIPNTSHLYRGIQLSCCGILGSDLGQSKDRAIMLLCTLLIFSVKQLFLIFLLTLFPFLNQTLKPNSNSIFMQEGAFPYHPGLERSSSLRWHLTGEREQVYIFKQLSQDDVECNHFCRFRIPLLS